MINEIGFTVQCGLKSSTEAFKTFVRPPCAETFFRALLFTLYFTREIQIDLEFPRGLGVTAVVRFLQHFTELRRPT